MRFLVDEMFPDDVARRLRDAGHDAAGVRELGLGAAEDREVLTRACDDGRVVVTENIADFVVLLDRRLDDGKPGVAVVAALKRTFPGDAGKLSYTLAERLIRWAQENPDPYPHLHWLD